jgi:hypothetical protein
LNVRCSFFFNKKPIQLSPDGFVKFGDQVLAAVSTAATAATFATVTAAAAAIATATAAAAATTIATTTAAATATWAIFARTRFIDCQGAALEVFGVEHLNSLFGVFFVGHFDECKTAGAAGHAILHYVY